MLGIDWTPFSAGVRFVEQIYLQSSALSPHSTGTRTGKPLTFPQGAAKWQAASAEQPILTAVSSWAGSHSGGRTWVSGSKVPFAVRGMEENKCCMPSSWTCCQDWTDCYSCLCWWGICLCMDTVFICRGAGLELIKTGTWSLPDRKSVV